MNEKGCRTLNVLFVGTNTGSSATVYNSKAKAVMLIATRKDCVKAQLNQNETKLILFLSSWARTQSLRDTLS